MSVATGWPDGNLDVVVVNVVVIVVVIVLGNADRMHEPQ